MLVPYNVDLQLFVMSKSGDDALQIIEQYYLSFNQNIQLQSMII